MVLKRLTLLIESGIMFKLLIVRTDSENILRRSAAW